MIPYADFSYFALMLYPVIPTLLLGLIGRINWRWVLFITVVVLGVQFATTLKILPATSVLELWLVLAYAVLELSVAEGFLYLRSRAKNRWVYYGALGLALLPLAVSKFFPLVSPKSAIGFLGISYVTFRSLDVIFGIQDGLIKTLPPLEYIGFTFFFPTISSGPIDRYRRFSADWKRTRTRAEFLQDLDSAVHRLFTGFLYKFIIAALIKTYWVDAVAKGGGLPTLAAYMYGYSFYLFFDFAGYSQFAIAFSYLFGIHTPENFNRPFIAKDIRDFWNRWHMTLSSWFRDHIYMRFVLAATKGKWFKGKYTASYLGFVLMFGLMGLWHGTALHYLAYGAYHALLFIWFDWFQRWNKTHMVWKDTRLYQFAGIFITFNAVCFGFLIFSGRIF